MVENKNEKHCPVCDRVPLILLSFTEGDIHHARIGCRCHSLLLLPEFEEEQTVVAAAEPAKARRSRPRIR